MTHGTVILRVEILFFHQLGTVSTPGLSSQFLAIFAQRLPVQLGHKLNGAEVGLGIAMAFDAPSHRQLFGLKNHFHLVDATVARLAADA